MPKAKTPSQSGIADALDTDEQMINKNSKKDKQETPKPKKSVGRPKTGKSSNPDYKQASVYLKLDTLNEAKRRLVDSETDLSELVEKLVSDWLTSQKSK